MDSSANVYFYIVPVLVFGPLFLWIFYNFGLKELIKIPGAVRRERAQDAIAAAALDEARKRKRGTGAIWLVRGPNKTPFGLIMQALTFVWFASLIGFFASSPPYVYKSPKTAAIKLSLSHPGQRKVECARRSARELAKLAPNMRAPMSCSRERWPVYVELELNGDVIFKGRAEPAGLSADGPSSFYRTFDLPSGKHHLTMRLRDDGGSGFGFEVAREMKFLPRQVVAIQFDADKGGFIIK